MKAYGKDIMAAIMESHCNFVGSAAAKAWSPTASETGGFQSLARSRPHPVAHLARNRAPCRCSGGLASRRKWPALSATSNSRLALVLLGTRRKLLGSRTCQKSAGQKGVLLKEYLGKFYETCELMRVEMRMAAGVAWG
ncbi:unconventional myosin heavy chain 6 [Striga asiatica]|uniref:Unconventional myosin heavy chain 6 n=1 Tax=Striga asiatica TaxID=4170 RepID=A0A5A7Q6S1_STRAF|nr:unconventional myosin heavy chain 6 [Striga asiatica]